MKPTSTLRRGLAAVKRHWRAGRYDLALEEVNRLRETWPDNPGLLLQWAQLVQLQGGDTGPTLEDAKAALQRATDLDDTSPEPWLELGHFLDAVEDDAAAAAKCYDKAVALSRRSLTEALLSQAQTATEIGRPLDALAYIAEAYWLEAHGGKPANGALGDEILQRLKDLSQVERLQSLQRHMQEMRAIKEAQRAAKGSK